MTEERQLKRRAKECGTVDWLGLRWRGHFLVNERKVDRPSYLVEPGDVISIRAQPRIQALYRRPDKDQPIPSLPWLQVDLEHLQATVLSLPSADDISLPVEVDRVVELLSR